MGEHCSGKPLKQNRTAMFYADHIKFDNSYLTVFFVRQDEETISVYGFYSSKLLDKLQTTSI